MLLKQNSTGLSVIGRDGAVVEKFHPRNKNTSTLVGQVARTDTTAKTLGYIPAGGIPVSLRYMGRADSNAGTTGVLSCGYTTGTEFLNAVSVLASSTSQTSPAAGAALGAVLSATADTAITGKYAETGDASTTGGPWTILIEYYMP